ncbi:unnamed protein product [Sphagnum jensenii]|uniref:Uncharacterized protein n=1 Tax=Sphagnum jensenii TaxID=128206 RepID=A0ABP0VC19_9BRYO
MLKPRPRLQLCRPTPAPLSGGATKPAECSCAACFINTAAAAAAAAGIATSYTITILNFGDVNQDSGIDTDKRSDHAQGLSSTGQIDCCRRSDLSQGLSGANQIDSEGRNELSQESPGYAPSSSVPQQSLEQLLVWENFFRRQGNGGSESVKESTMPGAWNDGTRLMHATELQLQIPMLPAIPRFHSCPLSRGTAATDEHLGPVDSRGPGSRSGAVS